MREAVNSSGGQEKRDNHVNCWYITDGVKCFTNFLNLFTKIDCDSLVNERKLNKADRMFLRISGLYPKGVSFVNGVSVLSVWGRLSTAAPSAAALALKVTHVGWEYLCRDKTVTFSGLWWLHCFRELAKTGDWKLSLSFTRDHAHM